MVSGTLAPLYSFWVKVGLKRGSGPDRGRSPVEWGDFPFVRPSVHPFPPSRAQEPARQALDPSSQASEPARQASEPASQASRGGTDGRTDGRTDERMENLPILQDFVPYQGCCPATAQLQPKNYIKRGKGTADLMMPLCDWLLHQVCYKVLKPFPIMF